VPGHVRHVRYPQGPEGVDGWEPVHHCRVPVVKPGKGAAFTRTKFKNLLTGAVVERNIRSGEKLEPANVETRDMQFLYKEGGDLVFMDQSNYEQVTISADLIGPSHDLMKDNLPCTVVFFNERPVDVTLPTFVFSRSPPPSRACAATQRQRAEARHRRDRRDRQRAAVHPGGDTIKIDTRTHEYVERVAK